MGVHHLWDILQPFAQPTTPEDWRDKRVAVDASIWIEQFRRAGAVDATPAEETQQILSGFLRRCMRLLYFGIRPVFVFDGPAPLIKRAEQQRRAEQRRLAQKRRASTTVQRVLAQQIASGELRPLGAASSGGESATTLQEARSMVSEVAKQLPLPQTPKRPKRTPIKKRARSAGTPRRPPPALGAEPALVGVAAVELASVSALQSSRSVAVLADLSEQRSEAEAIARVNLLSSASSFLGPRSAVDPAAAVAVPHAASTSSDDSTASAESLDSFTDASSVSADWTWEVPQLPGNSSSSSSSGEDEDDEATTSDEDSAVTVSDDDESFSSEVVEVVAVSDNDGSDCCVVGSQAASDVFDQRIAFTATALGATVVLDDDDDDDDDDESDGGVQIMSQPTRQKMPATAATTTAAATRHAAIPLRPVISRADAESFALQRHDLAEITDLLGALGIPCITSASEADAQCGHLCQRGLVDAVITEDSDVFLFGCTNVIRGFFSKAAPAGGKAAGGALTVQCYVGSRMAAAGLTRPCLIGLALLLGSDYTPGVAGVGTARALATVAGFFTRSDACDATARGPDGDTFDAARVLAPLDRWRRCECDDADEDELFALQALRQRLLIDAQCQRPPLPDRVPAGFPSLAVVTAYVAPHVVGGDALPEVLRPTAPRWQAVRDVAAMRCGWSGRDVIDRITAVADKLRADADAEARSGQRRITQFTTVGGGNAFVRSGLLAPVDAPQHRSTALQASMRWMTMRHTERN
jgi:DNA excision repair protein ERCC-5